MFMHIHNTYDIHMLIDGSGHVVHNKFYDIGNNQTSMQSALWRVN